MKIMGILNLTPDSFYDGGNYTNVSSALKKYEELKKFSEIIDIGAESTRPTATPIEASEEIARLEPVLKSILPEKNIKISIDTYHPETAEFALKMGADIINSVKFSVEIAKIVSKYNATLVIMARDTMGDFEKTVKYLDKSINLAKNEGVKNIILDPGIGFLGGYNADLLALKKLKPMREYYGDFKILVGASRKSFIGKVIEIFSKEEKSDRLAGTIAVNLYAAKNGADILRVHDPREIKEALCLVDAIEGAN